MERTKRTVSAEFVAVLARLLTRHGNRVGALLYGHQVEGALPARGGRMHVLNLLQRMRNFRAPTAPAETQLHRLLQSAQQMIPRRSMLFIVSDFISAPGWADALARLALRHDVVAVRLYDPAELELPDLGLVTIQDAETGEQLFVDTHDPGFRKRFIEAAERNEQLLHDGFLKAGVDTLEIATDDDLVDAVLRFAEMRRQRSRLAAGGGLPAHLAPTASWSSTTTHGGRS
jgi:uncharacterized protein (DUF58 family)